MKKTVQRWVAASVYCGAAILGSDAAGAAESSGVRTALDDAGQYFTAPLRWDAEDWTYFGVTAVAVAAAHQFDSNVRSHFATGSNAVLNGKDKNSLRDALPSVALIAGTWATAGYLGDSDGYRETWRLVESGVLSSVSAEVLTLSVGRKRPDATTSPNQWRQGGDSFPSVHASAAFAIGMTFAESGNDDYRWIRRILGYGVAGGTAYIRVKNNVHWVSDTVAGAALGIATARFVLNRENGNHAQLTFQPLKDGWTLSYNVPLH
ncbi:MAG: phosphoesterase PA-phosphatase related protein [Gammaproteobacteria bacterium]|nr:phosphoesterase PA-phosphatase related protein [Gammaproteobacteria bacterium]